MNKRIQTDSELSMQLLECNSMRNTHQFADILHEQKQEQLRCKARAVHKSRFCCALAACRTAGSYWHHAQHQKLASHLVIVQLGQKLLGTLITADLHHKVQADSYTPTAQEPCSRAAGRCEGARGWHSRAHLRKLKGDGALADVALLARLLGVLDDGAYLVLALTSRLAICRDQGPRLLTSAHEQCCVVLTPATRYHLCTSAFQHMTVQPSIPPVMVITCAAAVEQRISNSCTLVQLQSFA
jgi:hypothetical protein